MFRLHKIEVIEIAFHARERTHRRHYVRRNESRSHMQAGLDAELPNIVTSYKLFTATRQERPESIQKTHGVLPFRLKNWTLLLLGEQKRTLGQGIRRTGVAGPAQPGRHVGASPWQWYLDARP